MAWFRPMGAAEVAYHEATVVGREDDHPGSALAYYGSRGETPLRWGGACAVAFGLSGEVTPEAYRLAFGPGGFRHPATGGQLVTTRRPGFELVVAAHKSVALLGVVGHAEEMHAILDVESQATMAWLDGWLQARGGRRGRAQARSATTGLTTGSILVTQETPAGASRKKVKIPDACRHIGVEFENTFEMMRALGARFS